MMHSMCSWRWISSQGIKKKSGGKDFLLPAKGMWKKSRFSFQASPFNFLLFCYSLSSSSLLVSLDISYSYLQMDRNKIMNSVQKKAAFLKELREKVILFLLLTLMEI